MDEDSSAESLVDDIMEPVVEHVVAVFDVNLVVKKELLLLKIEFDRSSD